MAKEYKEQINIDTDLWISILQNEDITRKGIDEVLRALLECKDCEEICSELAHKQGKESLNKLAACYGQRILKHYPSIIPPKWKTGPCKDKPMTWHIPFLSNQKEDGRYTWKLRPELKEALLKLSW